MYDKHKSFKHTHNYMFKINRFNICLFLFFPKNYIGTSLRGYVFKFQHPRNEPDKAEWIKIISKLNNYPLKAVLL